MGESAEPNISTNNGVLPKEPEILTAEDEFYHQALILNQCFDMTGLSPRMRETMERLRWERMAADTRRAQRRPRQAG